jgi:hypothetical protein
MDHTIGQRGNMRAKAWRGRLTGVAGALLLLLAASSAVAQDEQGSSFFRKGTFDGMNEAEFKAAYPEFFPPAGSGRTAPTDIPDIFGPGAVLSVGNVYMKITNYGLFGNPFTNVSSDPSAQWPGASSVEYLNFAGLAVAGVNPLATDPNAIRRVSQTTEWRPATLDPVDKMYRAYDGILNGSRFNNDDHDLDPASGEPRIDEDFQDGHDNDLDGQVDEDFGAIGQQCFSCVIRDDTPQAINATAAEKHVPLGLECQQMAWAYSIPGFTDFNIVRWTIYNRSGHVLDSLMVGGLVDMDCGPTTASSYWQDDMDLAGFPSSILPHQVPATDKRLQDSTMRFRKDPSGVPDDSALCTHYDVRVNGFSICDDDGDLGRTSGIPTFLLVDHTIDPLGVNGPARVGFLAFRSFTGSTPYSGGGNPRTDQQRFEFMSGAAGTNIGEDGLINQVKGEEKGDYVDWWSCGPWRNVPDGGSVEVTVGFTVGRGDKALAAKFPLDYAQFVAGRYPGGSGALVSKYPSLDNAYAIQVAFEGVYEERPDWPWLTNGFGRETPVHPKAGEGAIYAQDCHDKETEQIRTVTFTGPVDWFDFDCDYCTGAYDHRKHLGMFHRVWNADAPPPNPNLNVAAAYNYTDNASRIIPAGDDQITVAWDNVSETTPDPKSGWLDFRGYRIWKAANWQRPVGSAGPSDDDWSLIGEFRSFHYYEAGQLLQNNTLRSSTGADSCPRILVPNYNYPVGSAHCAQGCVDTATVDICLTLDDLWDRQSGQILHPADLACAIDPNTGGCAGATACILGRQHCDDLGNQEHRIRYPVGRYRYVDREVKNGFVYFYSVTAFDSTGSGRSLLELSGRRAATESDGVVPQAGVKDGKKVWVVPNPYRGYRSIAERPSSWDLTPNGSDPTGTHIDFLGLPRGKWTIKVFTVSGDLVVTIKSDDPVNESIRTPIAAPGGTTVPGYNRQQDSPNDGQARWNLISRNGQDIVSGIYLFTVDSDGGTQRGKFVVIR